MLSQQKKNYADFGNYYYYYIIVLTFWLLVNIYYFLDCGFSQYDVIQKPERLGTNKDYFITIKT